MKHLIAIALLALSTSALAEKSICEAVGTVTKVQDINGATGITTNDGSYTYHFVFATSMLINASDVGGAACYNHKANKFCYLKEDKQTCEQVTVDL